MGRPGRTPTAPRPLPPRGCGVQGSVAAPRVPAPTGRPRSPSPLSGGRSLLPVLSLSLAPTERLPPILCPRRHWRAGVQARAPAAPLPPRPTDRHRPLHRDHAHMERVTASLIRPPIARSSCSPRSPRYGRAPSLKLIAPSPPSFPCHQATTAAFTMTPRIQSAGRRRRPASPPPNPRRPSSLRHPSSRRVHLLRSSTPSHR